MPILSETFKATPEEDIDHFLHINQGHNYNLSSKNVFCSA